MMSRLLSQTMSGFPPHMLLGNLTMSNPALSTDPMTGSADLAWPPHLPPHPPAFLLVASRTSPTTASSWQEYKAHLPTQDRKQKLFPLQDCRDFQHNLITKQVLFLSVTAVNPS